MYCYALVFESTIIRCIASIATFIMNNPMSDLRPGWLSLVERRTHRVLVN